MDPKKPAIIPAAEAAAPAIIDTDSLTARFVAYIDRTPRTAQTYLTNLRQFFSYLKARGISEPSRADIIAFRDYCADHYKPNTTAQYLRSVKAFFSWTAAEGIAPNIASNIHAPKISQGVHRKEALTVEEVGDIELKLSEDRNSEKGKRLYAMYVLAVNAGLRTVELSRANVKDFVRKGQNTKLYVWGKGHSEADQVKALSPEVARALEDYLKSRSDKPTANSPLFVSTGNRAGGKRIAARTISTMLKSAMIDAGYNSDRLTAHSLRHTAGTAVMTLTGNLYETQQYMRHSNPATTEIYLHTEREAAEADTARKLWNYYHGKEAEGTPREQLNAILDRMTPEQINVILATARQAIAV